MAKKRGRGRPKKQQKAQHTLPAGFWSQVGAVGLIAISLLIVVSWFGAGGPVLNWLYETGLSTLGYALYIVPAVFVYAGVEVFRAQNNRLPFVVKLAAVFLIMLASGLAGLMTDALGRPAGGFVGEMANSAMLSLVERPIAAFVYALLIAITTLFVVRMSPFALFSKLAELVKTDTAEQDENIKIMKRAADPVTAAAAKTPIGDLKVSGVAGPALEAEVPKKKPFDLKPSGFGGDAKHVDEPSALVAVHDPNWQPPSLELLEKTETPADAGDYKMRAQTIHDTLAEFGIDVEMEGVNVGPRATQYTLRPPSGVKLTRITALETNLALNLAAPSLRIEAPIPGQRAVGIEVPNKKGAQVRLYGVLASRQWRTNKEPLAFAVGKDIAGEPVVAELNKMPHLLIAGQTNSGKSVMIDTLLTSLVYRNSPSEMKLILVDPKVVGMARYEDVPHLLTPVITEPEKTVSALKWAVNEMERRYKLLAEEKIVDIKSYNHKIKAGGKKIGVADEFGNVQTHHDGSMPYIVIVIDELADLMMVASRDVEALIVRLAQKARAVGIHLVLATQSPRADVITGLIKANMPARIAFTVSNQLESRIVLDQTGAEKLLGQGDMLLYTSGMSKAKRIQGAWVMDEEVTHIVNHLKLQSAPQYNNEIISQPVTLGGKGGVVMDMDNGSGDGEYQDAVRVVIQARKASTSLLQRRLRIGYSKAARIIEEMEEQGIVGPADGARPREVLVSSVDELASNS